MIPITFEGVFLVPERREDLALDYVASYLWRYKPCDSEEFISFSEPFGIAQDEGVLINGIRHHSQSFNLGAVNYWIKDTLNTPTARPHWRRLFISAVSLSIVMPGRH